MKSGLKGTKIRNGPFVEVRPTHVLGTSLRYLHEEECFPRGGPILGEVLAGLKKHAVTPLKFKLRTLVPGTKQQDNFMP